MYTNHKGAYSSHTHVHKMVPYVGALYHGKILCTPITKGHTLDLYRELFYVLWAELESVPIVTLQLFKRST